MPKFIIYFVFFAFQWFSETSLTSCFFLSNRHTTQIDFCDFHLMIQILNETWGSVYKVFCTQLITNSSAHLLRHIWHVTVWKLSFIFDSSCHRHSYTMTGCKDSRIRKARICLIRSRKSLLDRSTLFLVSLAFIRAAWALSLASWAFVLASATWNTKKMV